MLTSPATAVAERLEQRPDDSCFVDRKRHGNLSESERAELLARYALLPTGPNGKKIGVAALEAEFGRSPGYISRTLLPRCAAQEADSRPLAHTRQCQAYKLTEDVTIFLAWTTAEAEGEITWSELAQEAAEEFDLELSAEGVRKHCLGCGWVERKRRILPWLTEKQMTDRKAWAQKNKGEKYVAWVDVDEAWFFTVNIHASHRWGSADAVQSQGNLDWDHEG